MPGWIIPFLASRGHCAVLVFHCVRNLPTVAFTFNGGNSRMSHFISLGSKCSCHHFYFLIDLLFPTCGSFLVHWKSINSHVIRSKVAVLQEYILFPTQMRSRGAAKIFMPKMHIAEKIWEMYFVCFFSIHDWLIIAIYSLVLYSLASLASHHKFSRFCLFTLFYQCFVFVYSL